MSSSKAVAFAIVGLSIGILGVTLSLLGLAIIQEGSTNFNAYPYFGVLAVVVGVVVSLISALAINNSKSE